MMSRVTRYLLILFVVGFFSNPALAQRGVGDSVGVAQQGLQVEEATFTGTLKEIQTGPCANTTGRSYMGTHFILDTDNGDVNVHLGAARAVDFVVQKVDIGQELRIDAFRTERMVAGEYVAQVVRVDGEVITLRDEYNRPVWAGSGVRGPNWGAVNPGYGGRGGRATGRGRMGRRGYCCGF